MRNDPGQFARDINILAAYLAYDDFHGEVPDSRALAQVDVVVWFGNQVLPTLTRACTLAQRAPAARLLLSGGVGHATGFLVANLRHSPYADLLAPQAEAGAEADLAALVAERAFSLPRARLIVENRSANGGENARFSLQALREAGVLPATVLLLQDPAMQRRAVLTWTREAELAGMKPRLLSHAAFLPRVEPAPDGHLRLSGGRAQDSWTLERFVALLLGEIRRLRDDEDGYGPRGRNFLPHIDIPEPVLAAWQRLANGPFAAWDLRSV